MGGGGGAEGRRTPMAAFRSLIVTCLARSTAWTTCCWCWGERGTWAGGDGEGLPPTRYAGFEALLGAHLPSPLPPPAVGTPTSCDRNGMSCAQITFSRLAISVCKERRRGTRRGETPTPHPIVSMAEPLPLRGTEPPPQRTAWMLSPPKLIQPWEERGAPSPPSKPHITPTGTPRSPPRPQSSTDTAVALWPSPCRDSRTGTLRWGMMRKWGCQDDGDTGMGSRRWGDTAVGDTGVGILRWGHWDDGDIDMRGTLGWGISRWGGTRIMGTAGWGYQDVGRRHQGMGTLGWGYQGGDTEMGDTGMMGILGWGGTLG